MKNNDLPIRKTLYFTVFISGLTSLAVEMAASRLLGNFFGTSNLVWASIIGLILIYLAAGYFLGGYWADRSPSYRTFYQVLIWAALGIAVVPVASRPVLRVAADAFDQLQLGVLFGSFSAVLILLIVPVTLLGTASPFAVRLAVQETRSVGWVAGRIYAISTLGSFIGTFLPILLLIPLIGTYRTFLVISLLLLIVALAGLWQAMGIRAALPYFWSPILVILLIWRGLSGTDKATQGLLYETESTYNYIQVLQQGDFRLLRLNEGQGVHSIYHPTILHYNGPWEMVLVSPYFNPAPYDPVQVKRIAIVGLAAGTTARQATAVYGPIPIDGFEIDPKIVEVGKTYFDMNEPNLNVIIQDGRWGLQHSPHKYQIISIDAYRPPYIPPQMTTQEFFQVVHGKLTETGVMIINVGRSPDDRRLINILASTILTVFPTVHVVDVPYSFNSVIYATVKPTVSSNLTDNLVYLMKKEEVHPLLLDSIRIAIASLQPAPPPAQVFTDDLSPIEWTTNNMVLSYLFNGDIEKYK